MAAEGDEIFNLSLTEKTIGLVIHHAVDDCLSKILTTSCLPKPSVF